MAEQKRNYLKNNTYILPEYDTSSAARELQRPRRLPEEKKQPIVETKTVKAKLVIKPAAVLGTVVVLALMLMVVMAYVRLYDVKSATGEINKEIAVATQENSRLRSQYESMVDFDQINAYATSHGMRKPTTAQTVYVNVPHQDTAQIRIAEESSMLQKAWHAIRDGFRDLMEYMP